MGEWEDCSSPVTGLYSCENFQVLGDISNENKSSSFPNTKYSFEGVRKLIA